MKSLWKISIFVLLGLLLSFGKGYAQKMHFVIVTQDDPRIGSGADKQTMLKLANSVEDVVGIDVQTHIIDGASASISRVQSTINNLSIAANDIVWYYYSGHGINYNTWPQSDQGKVALTKVHDILKGTNARLTIAMYDCCNYDTPVANPPAQLVPRTFFWKFLFLEAKGNLISSSCTSTEYSFGANGVGGIFTNSFIDALNEGKSWTEIMESSERRTKGIAAEKGRSQDPQWAMENFQDVGNAATPPAPGNYPADRVQSLEDAAKRIQKSIRMQMGKGFEKVTVTVKDLKRWNPGLTERNFKTNNGGKIYWDLDK